MSRTVIVIADQRYLSELKHAIHFPLSRHLQRLTSIQTSEGKQLKVEHATTGRKKRRLEFLLADSVPDAVARCRVQGHHWKAPYFVVIHSPLGMSAAKSIYAGLDGNGIADIVLLSNRQTSNPSAERLNGSGILEANGMMTDHVIREAVLSALASFVTADEVQFRIEMSLTSSVRPPPTPTWQDYDTSISA